MFYSKRNIIKLQHTESLTPNSVARSDTPILKPLVRRNSFGSSGGSSGHPVKDRALDRQRSTSEQEREIVIRPLKLSPYSSIKFETTSWLNKLISIFYKEWQEAEAYQEFICKYLNRIYNTGRPDYLSEITVSKVTMSGVAPKIIAVYKLSPEKQTDFLFDFEISYRGTFEVTLNCDIIINWPIAKAANIPLTCKIYVRSLNGRARVYFSSEPNGLNWYGFVGDPVCKFDIDPIIGDKNKLSVTNLPQVTSLLVEILSKRIRKYVLPNTRPLSIPFTKSFFKNNPLFTSEQEKSS